MRYGYACDGKLGCTLLAFLVSKGYKPSGLILRRNSNSLHTINLIRISELSDDCILYYEDIVNHISVDKLRDLRLDYIIQTGSTVPDFILETVKKGILFLQTKYDAHRWTLPVLHTIESIPFYPLYGNSLEQDIFLLYNLHIKNRPYCQNSNMTLSGADLNFNYGTPNAQLDEIHLGKMQRIDNSIIRRRRSNFNLNRLVGLKHILLVSKGKLSNFRRRKFQKHKEISKLVALLQDLCFHVQVRLKTTIIHDDPSEIISGAQTKQTEVFASSVFKV